MATTTTPTEGMIEHRSATLTRDFGSDAEYWRHITPTIDDFLAECEAQAKQDQLDADDGENLEDRINMHIHVHSWGPDESDDGRPGVQIRISWETIVERGTAGPW